MSHLAILLCGFSLVAAPVLAAAYLLFLPDMRKSTSSKASCLLLLSVIAALQWMHYRYLTSSYDVLGLPSYQILLMVAPGAFYLFSRSVLFTESSISWLQLVHLAWVGLAFVLPGPQVPTAAFLIGSGYTLWIAWRVWGLRAHRVNFNLEMFFFGMFAVMALCALAIGLALPVIGTELFLLYYSISIGMALALVVSAIIVFPALLSDILEVVDLAYARSKLEGMDIDAAQARVEQLIADESVYQNENLSLTSLAELAGLTPHQLSELINTRYGMGFPRFVRERRVAAAKQMLQAEPEASILAISMAVGFKSQSSFYTAFKDATGLSPGAFRQQQGS